MEAKELRIGNLVYWNGEVDMINSLSSMEPFLVTSDFNKCVEWDELEPIPLTEEWLVKFGFVKDADGSYLKFKMAIFLDKRFKYNLYLQTEETSSKWFEVGIKIKHVHQLQNLFFALTGEELTIKE